jgi:hypothetical protein
VQRFFKIVFIFLFGKKNTQKKIGKKNTQTKIGKKNTQKKIERKCTKQNQLTHVQQIAVPC